MPGQNTLHCKIHLSCIKMLFVLHTRKNGIPVRTFPCLYLPLSFNCIYFQNVIAVFTICDAS